MTWYFSAFGSTRSLLQEFIPGRYNLAFKIRPLPHFLTNLLCSCPHLLIFDLHNNYISLILISCFKSFYVWWIVKIHFKFFAEWNEVNNSTFILHIHKRVITGLQHSFQWIYLSTKLLRFAWINSQLFYGVRVYGLKWSFNCILASMSSNNFSSNLNIAKIYCVII